MQMNLGQSLILIAQIIAILQKEGIIDRDGNFVDDLQAESRAFTAIETQLKADGLIVPARVDSIVQILPLVLSMVK